MANVINVVFGSKIKRNNKSLFKLFNETDYILFSKNGEQIGKLIKDLDTDMYYMEIGGRRARLPVADRFMGYMTVQHTVEGDRFGLNESDFSQIRNPA